MPFKIIANPATPEEETIPFSVNEDDIDYAINRGQVAPSAPIAALIEGAAVVKVVSGNVIPVLPPTWQIANHRGRIILGGGIPSGGPMG
jgi:hypothetical protein